MDDARFCLRCGAALESIEIEGRARKRCPACAWVHYGNPLPVVAAIASRSARLRRARTAACEARVRKGPE